MIQIFVDGMEAELPEDFSFEYTVENVYFTGSGGFTYEIELPLKGSQRNLRIFGFVNDSMVTPAKLQYRACILSGNIVMNGIMKVVDLSDESITLQFLDSKAASNADKTLEETYINELQIGSPKFGWDTYKDSPEDAMESIDDGAECVAIPWVLDSSDGANYVHNSCGINYIGRPAWSGIRSLEFSPYLLTVARGICKAIGYSADFSEWEASEKRHLLVCNALPSSIYGSRDFSTVMPHWTINEFFDNIEPVLQGEFTIDPNKKSVVFRTTENILSDIGDVAIENAVDEFDAEISDIEDDEPGDAECFRNVGYKENGYRFWNLDSCDWYIRMNRDYLKERKRFYTLNELVSFAKKFRYSQNTYMSGTWNNNIFYAEDVDCWFCLRAADIKLCEEFPQDIRDEFRMESGKWYYVNELLPVNQFGNYIIEDSDKAETRELSVVPVAIDYISDKTNLRCMFLPFSGSDEDYVSWHAVPDGNDTDSLWQPSSFREIMAGKKETPEYYDKLYVGYWFGINEHLSDMREGKGLCPAVSNFTVYPDFTYTLNSESHLRLNKGYRSGIGIGRIRNIQKNRIYKFSFLMDSIPKPEATFIIKGQRYICSKIQATFKSSGMSKLLKGEFYRI